KGTYGVIKNKMTRLSKKTLVRRGAGRVMQDIRKYLNKELKGGTNTLSANALAGQIIVPNNKKVESYWQLWKGPDEIRLATDQEWCHLKGQGDGGDERIGNFVSGSKHCSTEQLAIELSQRKITQTDEKAEYYLKSTAYLIPDESMKMREGKAYL